MATDNPYTRRLEAELDAVVKRQIALRKYQKQAPWTAVEAHEGQQKVEWATRELAALDREKARLYHLLGRRMPLQHSISLDVPAAKPMQRGPVSLRPTRTVPTFMTRMIGGPGCK